MFVRRCYGRPGHGKLIRKARPLWVRSRDTVAIRAHLSALGCAPLNFLRRPNLKVSRLHVELLRLGRMMPVMFGLYSFLPTLAAETLEAKHVLIGTASPAIQSTDSCDDPGVFGCRGRSQRWNSAAPVGALEHAATAAGMLQ